MDEGRRSVMGMQITLNHVVIWLKLVYILYIYIYICYIYMLYI